MSSGGWARALTQSIPPLVEEIEIFARPREALKLDENVEEVREIYFRVPAKFCPRSWDLMTYCSAHICNGTSAAR